MSASEGGRAPTGHLVAVPGPGSAGPAVAAEEHRARHRVVAGPDDVPRTGDAAVDGAMDLLRAHVSGPRTPTQDAAVLGRVQEALAARLADAAG